MMICAGFVLPIEMTLGWMEGPPAPRKASRNAIVSLPAPGSRSVESCCLIRPSVDIPPAREGVRKHRLGGRQPGSGQSMDRVERPLEPWSMRPPSLPSAFAGEALLNTHPQGFWGCEECECRLASAFLGGMIYTCKTEEGLPPMVEEFQRPLDTFSCAPLRWATSSFRINGSRAQGKARTSYIVGPSLPPPTFAPPPLPYSMTRWAQNEIVSAHVRFSAGGFASAQIIITDRCGQGRSIRSRVASKAICS